MFGLEHLKNSSIGNYSLQQHSFHETWENDHALIHYLNKFKKI